MENEEILKLINEAETELPRNAIPKICTVLRHLAGVKHLGSDVERSDDPPALGEDTQDTQDTQNTQGPEDPIS